MMKEIYIFKDFIYDNLGTTFTEKKHGSETLIAKRFSSKRIGYCLMARFDKYGNYCYGYLVNEMGTALVDGKGFSIESFLNLSKGAIKEIKNNRRHYEND